MKLISIREHPSYAETAVKYFQRSWPDVLPIIYQDAIRHSLTAKDFLPQWYLLQIKGSIIGCAGLITNDFISRADLYPWLCALFIEEPHRGNQYPALFFERLKNDTKSAGYQHLYLCTEHVGYYEKYGFNYIGDGYHPWGEYSRIYEIEV